MIKFRCLLLCLTIALSYSCSNKEKERIRISNIPLITIDEMKKVDIKDVVYDLEIIELEYTQEALISQVLDVKIVDDKIYCFSSSRGGSVVVFDLSGKFLFKIHHVGRAKNEWIRLESFFIDVEGERVILTDYMNKILEYDLGGNFVKSYSLGAHDRFEVAMKNEKCYSITSTINTGGHIEKGSDYKINIYSKDGMFIDKCIKTKYNDAPIVKDKRNEFSLNFDGELIYSPILDDIVYKINKDSIFPYVQFAYKGDKTLVTNKKLNELRLEQKFMWGRDNITFFANNFIETPEMIYQRMGYYEAFDILYDKRTKQSVVMQFNALFLGVSGVSDKILYPAPYVYYKERFYAPFNSQIFGAPDDFIKDKMPDILKGYMDKYRDGVLNNLIFSYKIKTVIKS